MNARQLLRPGVFLSHSSADKPFVERLAADLQKHGIQVWLDKSELEFGDALLERIRDGIDQMDYLGVVLSPESMRSPWVRQEVDIAISLQRKVLLLKYRDCRHESLVGDRLYCDLSDPSRYLTELERLCAQLEVGHARRDCFSLIHVLKDRLASFSERIELHAATSRDRQSHQVLGDFDGADSIQTNLRREVEGLRREAAEVGLLWTDFEGVLRKSQVTRDRPIRDETGELSYTLKSVLLAGFINWHEDQVLAQWDYLCRLAERASRGADVIASLIEARWFGRSR